MPLPNIKAFCCAKCKATGNPCRNPAAFGMRVCRYHGAKRKVSIRSGSEHGRFKTGAFTQAAKAESRAGTVRLKALEDLGFRLGMMTGNRTAGRKPDR